MVDWPHKAESKSYFPPKGYAFLLFQVSQLSAAEAAGLRIEVLIVRTRALYSS